MTNTRNENTNALKICRKYLADKRDEAFEDIKEAILMGNSIITSASKYHLEIGDKTASIVNEYGVDVYESEGSAYTATVSFFARIAVVENTGLQNTFFLDEALTHLSPESSANLSHLLLEKSKTCQLVLIEQKPEVFAQGVSKRYFVYKNGEYSELREEGGV